MRLIGFTGKANTGKDTAAQYLVNTHNFRRYGFADPMKRGLNAIFEWTETDWHDRDWKESVQTGLGFSPRRAAQLLGTEWGRKLNENIWVVLAERMWGRIKNFTNYGGMVISDVRYDNEAAWIKRHGGQVYCLVRHVETAVPEHDSEKGIHPSYIDDTLWNTGNIDQLHFAIERVVQ